MKSIVHPLTPLFLAQYVPGPISGKLLPPAPVRGPGMTYFINLDGEKRHRRTFDERWFELDHVQMDFSGLTVPFTRLL